MVKHMAFGTSDKSPISMYFIIQMSCLYMQYYLFFQITSNMGWTTLLRESCHNYTSFVYIMKTDWSFWTDLCNMQQKLARERTLYQNCALSFWGFQRKLIKGDNFSTRLQDTTTSPLSHFQCTHLMKKRRQVACHLKL